jgi:hypothetical protein
VDVFTITRATIERIAAQVDLDPTELIARLIDLGYAKPLACGSIEYTPFPDAPSKIRGKKESPSRNRRSRSG